MLIADMMMTNRWAAPPTAAWLASLLRAEGVDLMAASTDQFQRGTPVYVQADANVIAVRRLMALHFIRVLPVVQDDAFVGIVNIEDLEASRAEIA